MRAFFNPRGKQFNFVAKPVEMTDLISFKSATSWPIQETAFQSNERRITGNQVLVQPSRWLRRQRITDGVHDNAVLQSCCASHWRQENVDLCSRQSIWVLHHSITTMKKVHLQVKSLGQNPCHFIVWDMSCELRTKTILQLNKLKTWHNIQHNVTKLSIQPVALEEIFHKNGQLLI